MTTRLIVSIHDVAPPHAIEVQHPWELCRSLGITPALFVVPNWHGESPSGESPAFVDWIRERASDGAELFLHGERHDEIGMRHRMSDELRALGRTANEGEFLTLDRWAARARNSIHLRGRGVAEHGEPHAAHVGNLRRERRDILARARGRYGSHDPSSA